MYSWFTYSTWWFSITFCMFARGYWVILANHGMIESILQICQFCFWEIVKKNIQYFKAIYHIYIYIYLDAKPMTFSFLCFSPKSTDWNLGIQHGNTDPSSKANKLGQNVSGWWFHRFWKILVSWVSWGYYSQYIGKNKKCSKPPARYNIVKWQISIFVDGFNWPTIWQWVSSACAA